MFNKILKWTTFTVICHIVLASAQIPPNVVQSFRDDPYGNKLYRKVGIMDGNLVRTLYYNQAEVAHWPDQPSGEWPKGTGHSYLDGVCMIVGAEVTTKSGQIVHSMETAYREWFDFDPVSGTPWGWEPVPGYVNDSSEKPAISNDPTSWPPFWPDPIFVEMNVDPALWQNVKEMEGEPNKDDDSDGYVDNYTYWYGYFGRGVTNADLETFFVMDDSKDAEFKRPPYNYYPITTDSGRGGLGLRVEVRGFQWSHVLAEDNIFWHYDIVNISDTTYDKTVFGFLTDVGIGGTDDSGDDNASFDTKLDLAYGYDDNGIGTPGAWSPVGYMGYAFLESPGNPYNGIDDDEDLMVDERRDDDIDNDGDWRRYSDLNGNGEWDPENEPLNDDLGKDGVGPYDRQYNGPDEGEGDGLPTHGEPNFDETDKDESDQIGLTSLSIYRLIDGGGGDGWPKHDEGLWRRMSYQNFDTSLQRSNIHLLFGSGPFELRKNTRERFSMALVFGSDLEDLVFNKVTVQAIYNANYNFAAPPYKPTLTAIPSNGRVYLYWDDIAEQSVDRFLRDSLNNPLKDFEGYLVYRSGDPEFQDIKVITDSKGEPRYWKPIAQFDYNNGIKGPDPIGINGAHFWRGNDTGLRHSYVDTDVHNGQTYYYAIVSYDRGDPGQGTLGLTPSECTKTISVDLSGNLDFIDINCAVVTPNAPAAGYIPPQISGDFDQVTSGLGTGTLTADVVDPSVVKDNKTYRLAFHSNGDFPIYSTSTYDIEEVVGDTTVSLLSGLDASSFGSEHPSPVVDGFALSFQIDTALTVDPEKTGWLIGSSNLNITATLPSERFHSINVPWPADYKITFYDENVDTSFGFKIPAKFKVWNMTEDREAAFEIFDVDHSNDLTPGDTITIVEFINSQYKFAYYVNYGEPFSGVAVEPKSGDQYVVYTTRPFYEGDYFQFSTKASRIDNQQVKSDLTNIKVVPNPYIGTAAWEKRNIYGTGRGERKIDFIHLPAKCTIRIFTISGVLVKTIQHNNPIEDGAQSWDLLTDDGMEIAYGIYLYYVEAPGIGNHIGKFAVIK
jgi:hypothetical protein